jgi:hypothetical protein
VLQCSGDGAPAVAQQRLNEHEQRLSPH